MKKELRRKMKELRAALPSQRRGEAALRLLTQLQKLPQFAKAQRVFCYASYGSELPTQAILGAHPQVAFPKVYPDGTMRFFLGGELRAGFRGIPEPIGGQEVLPKAGDLMLLPGLAFTRQGERLGYGGGYYDRYLAALQERPFCVGVCFAEQVVDEIATEPTDQRVDLLLAL
jgi:5-formyltetrahydrofolate cyclo-ligase